ncbi:MAG: hypothetical protein ACRCZI_12910, partial [Cetobacterium sp.]
DPVELLKAIRVLTHDTVRAQYPYVSLVDSVARLMTIKQYDDSLLDYAKRFKQTRDVMKTYIGAGLLDAFVERTEEYKDEQDADVKKTMKKDAWNRLMAYLFLKGADSSKYGSLTKKYVTDFSGGEDTYPKTLQTAVDVLTNHRFDETYVEKKKAAAAKQKADSEKATSFAQKEREKKQKDYICHCCGRKGHISPNCPKKDEIKKKDWHISKTMVAVQDADDDDEANEASDSEAEEEEKSSRRSGRGRSKSRSRGRSRSRTRDADESDDESSGWQAFQTGEWCTFQAGKLVPEKKTGVQLANRTKPTNLDRVIILDSGSTIKATFKTESMVGNIEKATIPLEMNTNGGKVLVKKTGVVPRFGASVV